MRPEPPARDDAPDLQCLQGVAQHDRAALSTLYRRYQPRLARFLARFTRHEGLIDEVINDTFWVVWNRAAQFRGDARVSTWIMGIAYRQTLKALRDRADPSWPEADPVDLAELQAADERPGRELHDWVHKGLSRLPPDLRATVELVYGQGHTLEEVAAIMDCPVGTAKSRLFHARVRLRHLLPQLAGETPAPGAAHG